MVDIFAMCVSVCVRVTVSFLSFLSIYMCVRFCAASAAAAVAATATAEQNNITSAAAAAAIATAASDLFVCLKQMRASEHATRKKEQRRDEKQINVEAMWSGGREQRRKAGGFEGSHGGNMRRERCRSIEKVE